MEEKLTNYLIFKMTTEIILLGIALGLFVVFILIELFDEGNKHEK